MSIEVSRRRGFSAKRLLRHLLGAGSATTAETDRPSKSEAVVPHGGKVRGELIYCSDPMYGGKYFYVEDGRRHWVPTGEHLTHYGFAGDEVRNVEKNEMQVYPLAGPLTMTWPESAWDDPDRGSFTNLREIATSRLKGSGIEFGAGTAPLGVPLGCDVRFSDFVAEQELRAVAYQSQGTDFVQLSYIMGLEDLSAIADESLDFIIACHVIEHLRNPLRAIEQSYRKLRRDGYCVLVVPDMLQTFDKDRALTTLDHLIKDYEDPSEARDRQHYLEYFGKVLKIPDSILEEFVSEAIRKRSDLHFHTWTYESFCSMVNYTVKSFTPWRSVWSQPTIEGWLEFYIVLRK